MVAIVGVAFYIV